MSKRYSACIKSFLYIFLISLLVLSVSSAYANEMCSRGAKNLRGDNEVIQGRGGLWSYMEQSGLNDHSMIGMQIDGKLQRAVVIFETMCEEGKIPSMETFKSIENTLSEARTIFNSNPDRTPLGKILEKIKTLNKNADALIQKIGN